VPGQNVRIDFRWAEGNYDLLPSLALDLARRDVAVIVAGGSSPALAAKNATRTIPIVFVSGGDLLGSGLVTGIDRPGGNATGVNIVTTALNERRLGLLRELAPSAQSFGALINPTSANAETQLQDVEEGGRALGRSVTILKATDDREIETAFESFSQQRIGAVLVTADPFFFSRHQKVVALAARYKLPAIYEWREFAQAGGLASYGTDRHDGYRFAGIYVGRILKGEKPADLPVFQSVKFEFVINLRTAKALGLDVSLGLSAGADELIE
jgi:putative ABC transport system substrate-binding protein